ncbi:DUF4148 domain-containing protein [Rivibacter subsaxonicus]|uniref:Uncharacterized protein DUF4148 n=1 Tax=Rivibacter subsaxonicus TaxID=457575 RepID=A0A4Q7W126_9BURK|nr:DUF4148 domain-containing protein [Rivibacter subsaxonicus]RZU02944.1 uncharacterized protein DUF4148 [Rivibacter subsaxonicus]
MNALNTKSAMAALTLSMCLVTLGSAQAAEGDAAAFDKPLTRAEVMADLQIWRESGLADLQKSEDPTASFSAEYRQAQARYERMRASPQFAMLVAKFAGVRGEPLSSASR